MLRFPERRLFRFVSVLWCLMLTDCNSSLQIYLSCKYALRKCWSILTLLILVFTRFGKDHKPLLYNIIFEDATMILVDGNSRL